MEPTSFGTYLKELRLAKGYGLREFARIIDMQPSNLSNLERGKLSPPRRKEALEILADALELGETDPQRQKLFDLAIADTPDRIPADLVDYATEVRVLPLLLRTVAHKRLSETQLRKLAEEINALY